MRMKCTLMNGTGLKPRSEIQRRPSPTKAMFAGVYDFIKTLFACKMEFVRAGGRHISERGFNPVLLIPVLFIAGALLTGPLPAQAGGQGRQEGAEQREAKPLVMLFLPNKGNAKVAAKNDPNAALRFLLRDTLRDSGKFRVVAFSPDDPVVVRALHEHTIAAADVAEPIAPEAMQRIGKAFGARYVLSLDATLDKDELAATMRMQEATGTDGWRTVYADQSKIPLVSRQRRRLKFDEAIALTADSILERFGFPARNLSKINANEMEKAEQKIAKNTKPDKNDKTNKPDKTDKTALKNNETAPNRTAQNGTLDTQKTGGQDTAPTKTDVRRTNEKPADKTPRKTNDKVAVNTPKPPRDNAASGAAVDNSAGFSAFTTDGAGGRDTQPATPDVAPPPLLTRPDDEAALARYRQAGDTANVIASLRKAINERPRDTMLRRQLIQAYQDRQLNDAALEETGRALLLLPDDAGLYRFYGNALLAKGDVPGALKAYREAIHRDPKDIMAQVALADALMADNQFGEAQAAYEDAAKSDPKSPLPHRRLANALVRRAVGDAAQYAASLEQTRQAHDLTLPADADSYREDYTAAARLMEARLRDMLNELQGDFQAQMQGKLTPDALKRALADLKLRADAAADYLDKLPPASGHAVTHAHYQQGASLLLQAVSLFRDYVGTADNTTLSAMKGAQVDASRELTAGAKSLAATGVASAN